MKASDFITQIYPKTLAYKATRAGLKQPIGPMTLTFSVTNRCNSRCKTCNIWQIYPNHWQVAEDELTLDEIEKIFRSMPPVYFFNLSGGEPFLRDDLPEIVDLAVEHLKPAILHTPTNAIMTKRTIAGTRKILENLRARGLDTPFTVKPSIDGVGDLHDEIRGVKGNWPRLLATIKGLQELSEEFPNLHVELGSVVSQLQQGPPRRDRGLRPLARRPELPQRDRRAARGVLQHRRSHHAHRRGVRPADAGVRREGAREPAQEAPARAAHRVPAAGLLRVGRPHRAGGPPGHPVLRRHQQRAPHAARAAVAVLRAGLREAPWRPARGRTTTS